MVDSTQSFHDGVLFDMLKGTLKNVKLKQTSDFIDEKAYDCMCEICEFLGIAKPADSLAATFAKRAANSVAFLPLTIYANAKTPLFCDEKGSFVDSDILTSAKIELVKLLESGLMYKLKRYISMLLKTIDDEFVAHYKYRFDENDVLEYFKNHKRSRQIMTYIMTQHLAFLKAYKPDIVANYSWYQKYLEISKDDEPLDISVSGVSVTKY